MTGAAIQTVFGIPLDMWQYMPEQTKNRIASNYASKVEREHTQKRYWDNVYKGRPPKYEQWMDKAVAPVYAEGGTDLAAAIAIGVSSVTLGAWTTELHPDTGELLYPSFSEAIHAGREASRMWWLEQGRGGVDGRPFNSQVYSFMMTNLFDYRTAKEEKRVDNNAKLSWQDVIDAAEEADTASAGKTAPPKKPA